MLLSVPVKAVWK